MLLKRVAYDFYGYAPMNESRIVDKRAEEGGRSRLGFPNEDETVWDKEEGTQSRLGLLAL